MNSTYPSMHPCIASPYGDSLSYPSMCHTKFGPCVKLRQYDQFYYNIDLGYFIVIDSSLEAFILSCSHTYWIQLSQSFHDSISTNIHVVL